LWQFGVFLVANVVFLMASLFILLNPWNIQGKWGLVSYCNPDGIEGEE
jgi:hypothetical protein